MRTLAMAPFHGFEPRPYVMTPVSPFVVHFSGAAPEQFARLDNVRPEAIGFPTLEGALFFARRTLARGGTVLRVEGPDGLALSAGQIAARCGTRD